ncbi:MAG: M48 family metallopeptidase [Cellvibrionaceae bacterium]|nr:M48 family metallopeptidase [Cellvibrionaceae bacterium]
MSAAKGFYYKSGSSEQYAAQLDGDSGQLVLQLQNGERQLFNPDSCELSEPVGKLPYRITFADGSCFESLDHGAIETLFKRQLGRQTVHRWEGSMRMVLLALLLLPLFSYVIIAYGLPWGAKLVAPQIPQEALLYLDEQVLESIDQDMLSPSKAKKEDSARLARAWARLPGHENYSLLQRDGGDIGANAFALPGGHIIVTDQLLEMTDNENEILAILAHEAGHVEHHHGLRNIIQSLGVAALISTIVGDVSGMAEAILVAAPVVMQQMAYTRDLEREADAYSNAQLKALGLPSSCLGASLDSLVRSHKLADEEQEQARKLAEQKAAQERAEAEARGDEPAEQELSWWQRFKRWIGWEETEFEVKDALEYLSTHPGTEERIEASGGTQCPMPAG